MEELYVVIGIDVNGFSFACHNTMEDYVFVDKSEAEEIRDFLSSSEDLKHYTYKLAKLTFLD